MDFFFHGFLNIFSYKVGWDYMFNIVLGQNKKKEQEKEMRFPWISDSTGTKRLSTVATLWTKRAFIISQGGNHGFQQNGLLQSCLLQTTPWVKPSVSMHHLHIQSILPTRYCVSLSGMSSIINNIAFILHISAKPSCPQCVVEKIRAFITHTVYPGGSAGSYFFKILYTLFWDII